MDDSIGIIWLAWALGGWLGYWRLWFDSIPWEDPELGLHTEEADLPPPHVILNRPVQRQRLNKTVSLFIGKFCLNIFDQFGLITYPERSDSPTEKKSFKFSVSSSKSYYSSGYLGLPNNKDLNNPPIPLLCTDIIFLVIYFCPLKCIIFKLMLCENRENEFRNFWHIFKNSFMIIEQFEPN